jgi:phage virion morphogenesis protein
MAGNVQVDVVYQDEQIQQRLKILGARVRDLTPTMRAIGEYLVFATDNRFRTETDPEGKSWQKLSPKTVEQKRRQGRINKILQSTGVMRTKVNYQATAESVKIGINDRKAVYHQLGLGVPRREILGVSSDDRIAILNLVNDFIRGAIGVDGTGKK